MKQRQLKKWERVMAATISGAAVLAAAVRCSPNTASVSKIAAPHPFVRNGAVTLMSAEQNATPNVLILKTHVVAADDGDETLNELAKSPDSIVLSARKRDRLKDRFDELSQNGATEIPALDDKSASEAEVYLKYDLSKDDIAGYGIDQVQAVLKPASDHKWLFSTKPSKEESSASDVALRNLKRIVIVFKKLDDDGEAAVEPEAVGSGKSTAAAPKSPQKGSATAPRSTGPETYPATEPDESVAP